MIVALWIAVLVLTAMTILLALVVSGLVQAMNELRTVDAAIASARPKGLPIGSVAPSLSGTTPDGATFDSRSLEGRTHVIAFVSPDCAPCEPLIRDLGDRAASAGLPPTIVVTRPLSEHHRSRWAGLMGRDDVVVLLQQGEELSDRFRTHTTPHVFVVDEAGTIRAQGVANDAAAIQELARWEAVAS